MRAKLVAAIVAVAVIAGGAYVVTRFTAAVNDDAIALVPDDAVLYANLFLSPSTSQKRALEELLEKFDVAPNVEEAKSKLVELIDDALEGAGLRYEQDIEPWLGNQAALYVSNFDQVVPEAAALIATDDEDATQAMIDKLDDDAEDAEREIYEGVEYTYYATEQVASGFIETFWVIGSKSGFEAVVDTANGGESLDDAPAYSSVTGRLTDDPLATYYLEIGRLFEAFERAAPTIGMTPEERATLDAMDFDELGPSATALSLTPERVLLETASVMPDGHALRDLVSFEDAPLPGLPGASWLALGVPDLGAAVERVFDIAAQLMPAGEVDVAERAFAEQTGLDLRSDLLSWIGDTGAFVQGTGLLNIGGGIVIETDDSEAARRALDRLAVLAAREGAPIRPDEAGGAEGYALQEQGMPEPVYAVVGEDRLVVAYGRKATENALSGDASLAQSEAFRQARRVLGETLSPAFYLDMDTVVDLAENMGADRDEAYRNDVRPWLDPLTHVIAGSTLDGDVMLQRIVIGVE